MKTRWSMDMLRGAVLILALVASGLAGADRSEADERERYAGRVLSVDPARGLMLIEESGPAGRWQEIRVRVRNAQVVRLSREAARPAEWREEPARLEGVAAGTFVVVIGGPDASGMVEATRVEIPRVDG
jgi:hypothetical protein